MTKNSFIKILGVLLVVGLLFAALPSGTAQADWSTFDNPDYYYADITTAPADTYYRSAGYSPDGTKIVAQKQWIDGTVTKREVVLMDADGSDEIVISPGNSGTGDIYQHGNPFWSDDGTVIGFVEVHNDNPNKVVVYNVAAGTISYIYEPISPADVSNPDFLGNSNTSIVFWAYGDVGGADLWTWDGTTLTNITDTDDFKEYEPISNADGSVILYWSGESTAEPVNTTHTLTNVGGTWTKNVGFTPIADTYWSYWTTPAATQIATTIMSSKDIAIYNNTGVLVKDLTGTAYSGGSAQWNFFGSMPQGPNGDYVITSNASRGLTAGRDIVVANPRILLYVSTTTGSDNNPGTENAPFATIGKAINEAVDGTTIHVAAGTYNEENITITKGISLLGAGAATTSIAPTAITNTSTIIVNNPSGNVTISGFNFVMQPKPNYGSAVVVTGTGIAVDSATVTISNNVITGSNDGSKSDYGFYGQNNNAKVIIENNTINNTGDNPICFEGQAGSTTVRNNVFRIVASPDYDPYFSMAYAGLTVLTPQIVEGNTFYLDHAGTGYASAITFNTAVLNDWAGTTTDSGHYTNIQIKDNIIYTNGSQARGINLADRSAGGGLGTITGAVITGNQIIGENLTDVNTYGIAVKGDVQGTQIQSNIINKVDIGIRIIPGNGATPICPSASTITSNQITSVAVSVKNECTSGSVDVTNNWWGSAYGPAAGSFEGSIAYSHWCANAACTTFAPDAGGNVYLSSTINVPGGILIGTPGLTYHLAANTVIQNDSPCFVIEASGTIIDAEPGAKCVPTSGANGIDVASALNNITIEGIEFDGTDQSTGDGIHFAGAVSDIVLVDNYMHDLDGDGIEFAGDVSEVVNIQGNMFKANGGSGINNQGANTVGAEYNSWGNVAGPAAGDGVSGLVTSTPFTHADLYLVSSGTPWANQVVKGQNITYTVKAHLVNVNAADFVLTYPAELTYVSSAASGSMGTESVIHIAGAHTLKFIGYNTSNVSGDLPLFTVTFTGATAGANRPLNFSYSLTSGFGMVGYESSNNVFVNEMVNGAVTIIDLPTISSTDIQGYYLTDEQRQFSVVLDNPSTGGNYAHVYTDFTITNAQVEQISLIEYSVDNGTNWVALGTGPGTSFANVGLDIVGYFGKMSGGGFALAPDTSLTTLFRVTFVTREQGATDFPTSYAVTMNLMDADALPSALKLHDFSGTMYVYDKPTVTYTSDPYFIVGEAGNFAVTITNPATGKNYANTVVFDVVLQNHVKEDISAISCTDGTTTWDLLGSLTQDGANVKARIGGLTDGFFTIPAPLTVTLPCTVTYATAGTYITSTSMVDVVSPLPERVVSADIPGTATVYAKPVITPNNLGGPFDAGVPETVSLSIANASIPEPFEIVFDYPAGTVIVYGSNTYTCALTCPAIPVDLTAEPTVLSFTVTFDEAWTGNVGVSLFDSDWTPADRLLASASATGVIVNGNFAVTGTFSMQGNASRAGIPVTLTWGGTLVTYGPSANTTSAISNNFSLSVLYGGEYTITTLQPRYLNVTADLLKKITVAGPYNMSALILKGGNAYWKSSLTILDNVINTSDASLVGGQYGTPGTETGIGNHGDCNFDGIVNIQDLALVGGNWSLTSAAAYNGTLPWVP